MNRMIKNLKKYMELNLEEKIEQIMRNKYKVKLLSKRDLNKIMRFMNKNKIYSVSIIEYIYQKSEHAHHQDLFELDRDFFLRRVCESPNIDVIKFLLSNETIFPRIFHNSNRDLMIRYACENRHVDVIKFLLSNETIFSRIFHNVNCDLMIRCACENGHVDVVRYLLSDEMIKRFPEIKPSISNHLIVNVSLKGHLEVMKFLLSDKIRKRFPEINASAFNNRPIIVASYNCHLEMVKFLLSDEVLSLYPDVDPSADNNRALRCIITSDRVYRANKANKVIKFLLSEEIMERFPKIDPSILNNEIIKKACEFNDIKMAKILLQNQKVIDVGFSEPMELARSRGRTEIMDLLMAVDKN